MNLSFRNKFVETLIDNLVIAFFDILVFDIDAADG